jgi:ACR3 family arsenite efflux pump ArsB
MRLIEKFESVLVLLAIAVGLALGQLPWIAEHAARLIVPCLMLMLCGVFLHIPLADVRAAWRDFRVTGLSLGINFLWTPFFAWTLGALFLREAPELRVGFLMLMVTPCTDWYLIFTGLARGNVALGTALLPWNLMLQIVLLPIYLLVLGGTFVPIQASALVESVAWVLLVPMGVACAVRTGLTRTKGRRWLEGTLLPRITPVQLVFLALAVVAMFASQGRILLEQPQTFLHLLPPVLLFFAGNFVLAHLVGCVWGLPYPDVVTLCCTTLARNSPIALAIAVSAFPDRPLIALALVIGPLIELPMLGLVAQALLVERRQGWWSDRASVERSRRAPVARDAPTDDVCGAP